ncbi:MAG TPA: hypothetical protein VFK78_09495 [Gemmatimonadales bacterium]|nr:hypothetical protein [Gemmatimonadales bacterium]
MTVPLLNQNQQRRLGTHLRMLADDLRALADLPELANSGHASRRVRDLLADADRDVETLRTALGLPVERPPALARRVAATAEVWAVHLEDLRPRRLAAYGAVHPDLGAVLEPPLERLHDRLLALADAALLLPEQRA